MEIQRMPANKKATSKKNQGRERVLVAVRLEKESSGAGERDAGSSSPGDLLDDFDEQLCFELEEVGKELDRYKEEASQSPGLEKAIPLGMVPRESSPSSTTTCSWLSTPSPPFFPFPVLMHEDTIKHWPLEAHSPTSLGTTEMRETEARTDSAEADQATAAATTPDGHSSSPAEKNEDEYKCQVKALSSLRFSLVVKVRMLITHKKNLSLQKDLLLENFDGDKSKLIENLLENVSQSKQIDAHIHSLNEQISVTNKKIVELKKLLTVMNSENIEKEQHDSELAFEQSLTQTHSEVKKDLHKKSKKMCEYDNINLAKSEWKTSPGKGMEKSGSVEGKSVLHNNISGVRNNTVLLGHESNLPKLLKPSEVQNNVYEVMEKLSGQLAVHPTSKNTLWCNTCNLFFISIKSYLKHLEASEHLDKVEAMGEKSLYKLFSHSTHVPEKEDSGSTQEEAFGVEFLRSAKVVFCSLCECALMTKEEAASHAQSLHHTIKYKEYLLNNTSKELAFLKAKMRAFTEYCKRRKATVVDNKEKKENKNKVQSQKGISKIDENTSDQKTDPSKKKKMKSLLDGKNDVSSHLNKEAAGSDTIMKNSVMSQVSVNTSPGRNIVGRSRKRTDELPSMNKRLKISNE